MLFYKDTVFFGEKMWTYTVRQSVWFIIIGLFPTFFIRKPKNRYRYLFGLNLLVSFILFADELYYEYATNILSVMQARKFTI